jgi:uncharacterized protein YebE (UPF0316 family)
MEILIVFTLKLIDNTLNTMKNIFLIKEKFLVSSLLAALSTAVYMFMVMKMAKTDGLISIVAIFVATFIGTLLPGTVVKKTEKDRLFIYDITADNFNNGKKFADILREADIATKTSIAYNNEMDKTLSIQAYCSSRDESRLVNENISSTFKYNIYAPIKQE